MKRIATYFTLLSLGFCLLSLCRGADGYAKVTRKHMTLSLGETKKLSAKKVTSFRSNKDDIVTVTDGGRIHGIKAGKAKIIATTKKGRRVYHITVTKRGMVFPSFTMMNGEHLDVQFSTKEKINRKKVTWTSLKKSIATVSKDGIIHAKKKGQTRIKMVYGKKTYLCHLTVTKKEKNVIYLTFDDGPNRYSTTKILNILKKHKVKATFFELKPAKADFDLTKRVLKEGHSLAMHGYQHKYDRIYKSVPIYRDNLDKQRNLFFNKFGVWCTVTRFPGGSSNTVSKYNPGVMTKITDKIHDWGYHYFDWNVSSGDAGDTNSAAGVYKNVTSGLKKGRGNVVLMHDFRDNNKTINALKKIIKYGKKHGYVFRPITASTAEVHHAVNN